jgi:3-oxoacyl-[acyl-carrier protein] reductase
MDLGLQGKWALVCGASKGLGRGCAEALAAEGVNLVLVARGAEVLEATASEIRAANDRQKSAGGQNDAENSPLVLTVAADITTPQGRAAALAVASGPGVAFDIVVTNAGGPPPGDFRDWDRDAWIKAVDANMLTPIELIKATVDGMAARGFGRIVNITSSAVKAPIDILGLSNGARSGLTGFVAGVARNPTLASRGVTLNNLLPGKFDTDRIKTTLTSAAQKSGKTVDEVRAAQIAQIPAQRFGTPQEFGQICAFLCSVQAAYITGQNVLADGGAYAGTF